MQLSLPIPASSTPPPVTNAGPGNNPSSADPSAKNQASPASKDSFESYLDQDDSSDKSATEGEGTDAEKAAAILAASFWMPIVPVAPPPNPALGVGAQKADAVASDNADAGAAANAACFTSNSSRAFAAAIPAGAAPTAPSAFSVGTTAPAPVSMADALTAANVPLAAVPANALPATKPTKAADTGSIDKAAKAAAISPTIPLGEVSEEAVAITPVADSAATAKDATLSKENPLQEKIAAQSPLPEVTVKSALDGREKYFLDSDSKRVASANASVGITVAQGSAPMSAAASARSKSASISESTASLALSSGTASVATLLTPDAPAPVATVRETMGAVISAVDALERRADVQQKSVDLHFHVGGENLGLRVELRDGIVHTTFRTESAEMNGALAREWHSMVQPAVGRENRLAEPVFTSSNSGSGAGDSALGQGAPQQQQREQRTPPSFASALKREFYDSGVTESPSTVSSAVNSSQLLNALA